MIEPIQKVVWTDRTWSTVWRMEGNMIFETTCDYFQGANLPSSIFTEKELQNVPAFWWVSVTEGKRSLIWSDETTPFLLMASLCHTKLALSLTQLSLSLFFNELYPDCGNNLQWSLSLWFYNLCLCSSRCNVWYNNLIIPGQMSMLVTLMVYWNIGIFLQYIIFIRHFSCFGHLSKGMLSFNQPLFVLCIMRSLMHFENPGWSRFYLAQYGKYELLFLAIWGGRKGWYNLKL